MANAMHNIYFPEWDDLRKAAIKESVRQGEVIQPGTLLRRIFQAYQQNLISLPKPAKSSRKKSR